MLSRATPSFTKKQPGLLRDAVGSEAHILVSGSGTGHEAVFYALENPGWNITGFDPSEKMVQVAAKKARAEGVSDRVRFIQGTAENIPNETFDAATSILVKHFIAYEDKPSFLENIAKRLKPGALFITVDITGKKRRRGA